MSHAIALLVPSGTGPAHGLIPPSPRRPMTIDDLLAVKGVSDPQISPDGALVVYVVSELDRATDKTNSSLWLVPASGGEPKRLTTAPGTNNHPRWSPDGKTIAFVSSRGGSSQVWLLPIDGGEARPTHEAADRRLRPDLVAEGGQDRLHRRGLSRVRPPRRPPPRTRRRKRPKSKVRTYDRLMIRHWNAWDEGKRSHLFVADATTGEARDLTPKLEVNTPPAPFGGSSDYAWSPDGKELAFTAEPHARMPPGPRIPTSGSCPPREASRRTSPRPTRRPTPSPPTRPTARCSPTSARRGPGSSRISGSCKSATRDGRRDAPTSDPCPRPARALVRLASDGRTYHRRHRRRRDRAHRHASHVRRRPDTPEPRRPTRPALVTGGVQSGLGRAAARGEDRRVHPPRRHRHRPRSTSPTADGSGPDQLTHHNAPLLAQLDLPKPGGLHLQGGRRRRGPRLADAAAGLRPEEEVSRSSS